jgi:hypothetical protein
MPALSVALLAALFVSAEPAPMDECLKASEQGQLLRQQGKLFAARHQFDVCAQSTCPAVVQSECTRWLDELLTTMPTMVVVVRIDGVDQRQVNVLLDGQMWLSELTGNPQEIEPGAHRITIEFGGERREQQVVVNVNEKNRLVVFTLRVEEPQRSVQPPWPSRPAPWLAGGLTLGTVVGLGLFTGFGLAGRTALDGLLADPCAATKTCDPSRADAIRRDFTVADVALAVAVVAAALAVWQWWSWAQH